MPLREHSLVDFLRRSLTADKQRAQQWRKTRPFHDQPCPSCGQRLNGWYGSTFNENAAVRVGHGDERVIDGCDLNAEQWEALADDGPTDKALARIVDLDSKLAIVDLCAPPLVETTGPEDTEKQFIPGEGSPWALPVLKLLALPYAQEPEYQNNRARWEP